MKFAFSTVSCPKWDFATIASRAKEYGYDGVEIRGFLTESILTSSNIFLSDPTDVRGTFSESGIEIACLASSIAFTGDRRADRQASEHLRRFIDIAKSLECQLVKIFDTQIRSGRFWFSRTETRAEAAEDFIAWLSPSADYAAEHGVSIVIENALSFRNAKELWTILEMLQHPSVAVCWDVFNAALIGEVPSISVPTLNHRIQYTQVKDAHIGPLGASFCKLGEGSVRVEDFLRRLMGIGYTGYVTLEWEKAWLPNLAEPEEILPHAITKLRDWTKPPAEEEPKKPAKPSTAAPAAPAAAPAAAH